MRRRIMVIGRDADLRARLARLLSGAGYRPEVAESLAHARRAGLERVALAIVARDGSDASDAAAVEAMTADVGRVLVVASPGAKRPFPSDVVDLSDEAGLLAQIAEALTSQPEADEAELVLQFSGYRLDLAGHSLADPVGKDIPLTQSEFSLLRAFVERAGRVLSRDQLLQVTAGRDAEPYDRSVDMLVARLRRKIEPDSKRPSLIVTVPGSGYKFAAQVREASLTSALPGPEPPPAPSGPPRTPERRHITALAAELVPAAGGQLPADPEDLAAIVGGFRGQASAALTRHGGVIGESRGREIFAYFGYPTAYENDSERAVRTALAIQRGLAQHNVDNTGKDAPELSARIGLECGLVVVDSTGEMIGDAPNIAARVQTACEPGSVLVTMNVLRQVPGLFVTEERGSRELDGVSEPVNLFRIVRASGGGRRAAGRAPTPFVGREEELSLLARRWERALAGEGQLVLIVGEPGIGKSRLVEEFRAKLAETSHTWAVWSALQLLQNTPLHPIAEWGRQRFGEDASAEERLADLESALRMVGLNPTEHAPLLAPIVDIPLPTGRVPNLPPEEMRRRQLAAIVSWILAGARSQPLAIAFEDLHWADPTSLDLMRALAERGGQAPLFIIATARPEFRPPWSLRSHHGIISLSPLDRANVAQMVGELAARHALSKEVVEGVSERTGGVPLFVEEVTRLLLERGQGGGAHLIPPTLQQSLAARLDRLGEAREVAQIGAVLGRSFSYALLRDVASASVVAEAGLVSALDRLADADLLIAEEAGHEANYRFKHALIQDAAYESLLKSRRQALHRHAAELLRDQPERAAAEPEIIAHHFTQGCLDDLAIEWWGKAGDQALRRSAFQEAIAHLGKAIAIADKAAGADAPTASSRRLKLQTDYGQALIWSKGFAAGETKAAFERAREIAAPTVVDAERYRSYHAQWGASFMGGDLDTARKTVESFLLQAEADGRAMETAVALRSLGLTCLCQGELGLARSYLERALTDQLLDWDKDARRLFGTSTQTLATAYLAWSTWFLGDVVYARRAIERAVRDARASDHAVTIAQVSCFGAHLEALRDDPAATRLAAEPAVEFARAQGIGLYAAMGEIYACWARGRLLDPEAGVRELREALAAFLSQGNRITVPWCHGMIADLEAIAGRADSALASVEAGLTLAKGTGERWADPVLFRRKAEILLKRDPANPAPAEEALHTAIAVAKQQGARSFELRAALALAKLYQSTGRPTEAHAVVAPALEGFSPTREMPEIAEAQALLASLGAPE
jgi:class 3 adenylate cyclase/tetratricopeptide (TPR) repeat protein